VKLIKMKIKRTEENGRTHYDYPSAYKAELVKFGPIYESALPENLAIVSARGNKDEFILFGVEDKAAQVFLSSQGVFEKAFSFEAQEITEEAAKQIGSSWTRQTEKITDEAKVIQILAKVARNEQLTQAEKDALDPNKPESGISLSKSFEAYLNEFLGK